MPFIDFQARGELIAAHKYGENKFVILVNTHSDPHPWVVSTYTDGSPEWDSGSYTDQHQKALALFSEKVRDYTGVTV